MQKHLAPLPTRLQDLYPTVVERFWSKVKKTDSCWIWTGGHLKHGYGMIRAGGTEHRRLGAHRVSWMIHHNEIPNGLYVLHHCDNPPCVNPAHLFLGTHLDNVRDMHQKGRASGGRMFGNSFRRTTTEEQVRQIRGLFKNRHISYSAIARTFNLGRNTVKRIIQHTLLCYK